MTRVEFEFPAPAALLSLNDRLHWAQKARLTAAWRDAAGWAAVAAQAGELAPGVVTVHLPVNGNRRRDPHNYVATVKPIVDGMVDAGCWPDDTAEWVATTEPVLVPHKRAELAGASVRVVVAAVDAGRTDQ